MRLFRLVAFLLCFNVPLQPTNSQLAERVLGKNEGKDPLKANQGMVNLESLQLLPCVSEIRVSWGAGGTQKVDFQFPGSKGPVPSPLATIRFTCRRSQWLVPMAAAKVAAAFEQFPAPHSVGGQNERRKSRVLLGPFEQVVLCLVALRLCKL